MSEPALQQEPKAVAKRKTGEVAAPVSEGDALISMIERAARDPNVDIDKMERLFTMRERMTAHQAKTAYLKALSDLQAELPTIAKLGTINKNEKDNKGQNTGKQEVMTKYAKWEDVVDGISPFLFKNGFSLSFRIANPTPDRLAVTAVLGHKDGHSEETSMSLPIDSSGAKNNVQGWGSSTSYGKRYTAFALLNISARGEDDDGRAAGEPATIGAEQIGNLQTAIDDTSADIAKFCRYFKIEAIGALPASRFQEAMTLLEGKKRAQI